MAGVTPCPFTDANCGSEHWRVCNQRGDLRVNCKTVPQWAWLNWKVFSVFIFEANKGNTVLLLFEFSLLIELEFLEAFLPTAIYIMQFSMTCVTIRQ